MFILAIIFLIIGMVPLLGWLQYLTLILAFLGALTKKTEDSAFGFGIIIVFAFIRLAIGGGVL